MTRRTEPFTGLTPRLLLAPVLIVVTAAVLNVALGRILEVRFWTASSALLILAITLSFVTVAIFAARNSRERWAAIVLVILIHALNLLVLTAPRLGVFAELSWNWQGKTLDLVWMLTIIALLRPDQRQEIGWTLRINPGTLPIACINIAILAVAGFFLAEAAPGTAAPTLTIERILFDISYPNLVEEIAFRGFLLALLDRVFSRNLPFGGTQIGWGVVLTAWLFGLGHGIQLDAQGMLSFDFNWLMFAFVMGLVLGWIRTLTGSLWPAFLAHLAPEFGILIALTFQ